MKPNDIDELKERIFNVSNCISPEVLENVSNEIYYRLAVYQEKSGGYQIETDKN